MSDISVILTLPVTVVRALRGAAADEAEGLWKAATAMQGDPADRRKYLADRVLMLHGIEHLDEALAVADDGIPSPLAAEYVNRYEHRIVGALAFTRDLMRGDPTEFKQGYSIDNALLATGEAFGLTRGEQQLVRALTEAGEREAVSA